MAVPNRMYLNNVDTDTDTDTLDASSTQAMALISNPISSPSARLVINAWDSQGIGPGIGAA